MASNKFISFSSGSIGNCYYLKSAATGKAILIEAGMSLSSVRKVLKQHNESIDSIAAIIVSHAHNDHVRHLQVFCEKLHLPVYMASDVKATLYPPLYDEVVSYIRSFEWGDSFDVADFHIRSFEVPHDVPNTGYFISTDNAAAPLQLAFLTDMGHETPEILAAAQAATTLIVEADYDKDMLLRSNYPQFLKDRITQGCGHFSNADCAEFLKKCYHSELRSIFLCHLSGNNNTPQLAYTVIHEALKPLVGNNRILLAPLYRGKALSFNI